MKIYLNKIKINKLFLIITHLVWKIILLYKNKFKWFKTEKNKNSNQKFV